MKKIAIIGMLLLILISCGGSKNIQSSIQEDDKQIPKNFGREDVVILAVKAGNFLTKIYEKRFPENYFGKYVLIEKDELKSAKYSDVSKYRYLLVFNSRLDKSNPNSGAMTGAGVDVSASAGLMDRATQRVYQTKLFPVGISNLLKDYLVVLEQVRRKNSN